MIQSDVIYQAACKLHLKTAAVIPSDVSRKIAEMRETESNPLPAYVLDRILENFELAAKEKQPMCADTGLPRIYAKIGNEAQVEGGMVGLEQAIRRATASATRDIPLRPNRVHPLSRQDNNNNVGAHAPTVDYSFEPNASWLDLTAVHKGGLFGGDYRMLFPADGIAGIKRFYLDCLGEFLRRGMSCQPVTVGVGIGGAKDTCVRLAKEAACLRVIGDRNPNEQVAALEEELKELGNQTGFAVMGFSGDGAIMDVHVEVAHTHTGGMPVAIQQFCFAQRRQTIRIQADNSVEERENPMWFTDYYRRETVD